MLSVELLQPLACCNRSIVQNVRSLVRVRGVERQQSCEALLRTVRTEVKLRKLVL